MFPTAVSSSLVLLVFGSTACLPPVVLLVCACPQDCLYLNAFTAASSVLTPGSLPASLPVFVWVHGGGLMSDTVESNNQV